MPVRIDRFEEVDALVFDEYPQPAGPEKKVDPQWEELLTKLDQGSVIRLPLGDETELRGLRLALGRRAAGRGFKVETRTDGQTLVVRKRNQSLTPKPQAVLPTPAPPENGRRKRRGMRGGVRRDTDNAFAAEQGTMAEDDLS